MSLTWLIPAFCAGALVGLFAGAYLIWQSDKEDLEKTTKENEELKDKLRRNEDSWCEMISVACGNWQKTMKDCNDGWQKRFDELERLKDTDEPAEPTEE